jgi:hypothetical protein
VTGLPSNRSSPAEGRSAPTMHLTNVDLPAPLSPISATTSPARTVNEASRRASTEP